MTRREVERRSEYVGHCEANLALAKSGRDDLVAATELANGLVTKLEAELDRAQTHYDEAVEAFYTEERE